MNFSDPTIQCPHCQQSIKLTESLAMPLLEQEQQKSRQQIQAMQEKMQQIKEHHLQQKKEVEEERQTLRKNFEQHLAEKLNQEKQKIIDDEKQKAQQLYASELKNQAQTIAHLEELKQKNQAQLERAQEIELAALKKQEEFARKEQELELSIQKRVFEENQKARHDVEEQLKEQFERQQQEKQKAQELYELELKRQAQTIIHLEEIKEKNQAQLKEAQKIELQALKKQEELAQKEQELELAIQKRVFEENQKTRQNLEQQLKEQFERQNQQLIQQQEEKFKQEQSQKELHISGLQNKIEELSKKAQQGSQQLQGEAFEIELENTLKERFYQDQIEAVAKGVNGADLLQIVHNLQQKPAGKIIWELKNAKHWKGEWLEKLRQDQRQAGADVAVLLSYTLPFKNESFDMIDGVWVAHPRFAVPLAMILRDSLLQIQKTQHSQQGIQQKSELVYSYLNSPAFRLRLEAIVEAFSSMKEDLDKEKKVILKQWEKRNKQIERVIESTIGMYGDLQGIAGRDIQSIPSLEFEGLLLESSQDD